MESQLSLFTATEQWQVNGRPPEGLSPEMSAEALTLWQERIREFQLGIRFLPAEEQTSLFDLDDSAPLTPSPRVAEAGGAYRVQSSSSQSSSMDKGNTNMGSMDMDRLDPFSLPQKNINFWQAPVQEAGVAALYFVIDYERSLLLYVGETIHSNKRWKGVHDCKRYLANYRQVHYAHGLTTQLGIAFWPHAPKATRARQRLETQLIKKWRPPFNKENWSFWGTPFVGGKIDTGD